MGDEEELVTELVEDDDVLRVVVVASFSRAIVEEVPEPEVVESEVGAVVPEVAGKLPLTPDVEEVAPSRLSSGDEAEQAAPPSRATSISAMAAR